MNNIEDFKNYVDEKIEDIKITKDIRNNILKKSNKKKTYNLKYAVMIILPILLITCIFFNEPLGYATQNILKYVPGINKLLSDTGHKQYGLSGSIKIYINEENYIKVNSAYNEDDIVTLTMESNIPEYEKINAIDERGKVAKLVSFDVMKDTDNHKWSGKFIYKFNNISNKFNIVYDKYTLPIIMTELPEVSSKEHNFISIEDINIDIAVITNYVKDKLEVNLLTKSNYPNKTISFPLNNIYLLDSNGKKYYCSNHNSENSLYFNRKLEPDIKLVIPYVSITDEDVQSKVTINKNQDVPFNVRVGNYDLKIKGLKWVEYAKPFKFKTEKKEYISKEEAQRIELAIDRQLVETNELKLHDISVDVDKKDLKEHKKDGVKLIFSDSFKEKNSENAVDNYINKVIYSIKKEQQEVNITFTEPIMHTENKVIIPLQP